MSHRPISSGHRNHPPWSQDDLAALRDHLKAGSSLIDVAGALGREPEDIEGKIAELYRPGQRLVTSTPLPGMR